MSPYLISLAFNLVKRRQIKKVKKVSFRTRVIDIKCQYFFTVLPDYIQFITSHTFLLARLHSQYIMEYFPESPNLGKTQNERESSLTEIEYTYKDVDFKTCLIHNYKNRFFINLLYSVEKAQQSEKPNQFYRIFLAL